MTKHIHIHLEGDNRLTTIIEAIQRMEQNMSAQEAELNEALADQGAKLDNLVADVNRLVAAVEAGKTDLTDEIAAVKAATEKISGASDVADAEVPE